MRIYDALMFLGRDHLLEPFRKSDVGSLRRCLDKYGIKEAFLCGFACRTLDVDYGNRLIFEAARKDLRLIPCPAVLPNAGREVGREETYVGEIIRRGARCVCLYPKSFGTSLDRRIVGPLFAALENRRLPMALFETDLPAAASLAVEYPQLPIIVHAPAYRERTLLSLLKNTPNLYISVAPNFAPYRGLEMLAEECGVERILFASSYPVSEPGAPISYVMLSGLGDREVKMIMGENMRRLINAVRLDGESPKKGREECPRVQGRRIGGVCAHVWRRTRLPWKGIVDMHGHYGKYFKFPIWGGEADDLVAEMDRIGVERIVVSHQACMCAEVAWGNNEVLKAIRRYPGRILGYAACFPQDERLCLPEVQRCIKAGMCGIKLHNAIGVAYTDERLRPVWEFANARGLPVLLHSWGDLDKMETLFDRYRRAKIILGHAGSAKPQMYVEFARKYPHLWLELCCSMSPYGVVEYFVREVGPERILFGSDAPWMAMQHQIGRVLFADVPERAKRMILVENPTRLLDGIM